MTVVLRYLETFVAVVHQRLSAEDADGKAVDAGAVPFSYPVEKAPEGRG